MNRQIVQTAIANRLIFRLAEQEGVTVSQSDVDELLESAGANEGREQLELELAQTGVPPSQIDGLAKQIAMQRALLDSFSDDEAEAQDLYGEAAAELAEEVGVTVSPRYGEWDQDEPEDHRPDRTPDDVRVLTASMCNARSPGSPDNDPPGRGWAAHGRSVGCGAGRRCRSG